MCEVLWRKAKQGKERELVPSEEYLMQRPRGSEALRCEDLGVFEKFKQKEEACQHSKQGCGGMSEERWGQYSWIEWARASSYRSSWPRGHFH
jgi:hypothetical protein